AASRDQQRGLRCSRRADCRASADGRKSLHRFAREGVRLRVRGRDERRVTEAHAASTGPRYNLEVAAAFHRAMRAGGVDFAVYVPDSLLDPIERLLEDDPAVQTVVCTREDEGIAIAMGAQLGGKVVAALMEGSGLGLSGLILARGLVQRSPTLLIASHDRALG